MKVLMISKALIVGAYHGKLREIAKLGVDLTLILPHRWAKQKLEIREAGEYQIQVTPCVLSGHNHFHFYRSLIDSIDADLVHIDEDPWSLVTFQFMKACIKHRKPAVFFTWQNIYKNYPPPFSYFERFAYGNAAGAIAGNTEVKEVLGRKQFSSPIAVIPQFGVDPEFFCKLDVNNTRKTMGLEGKFVVGFVGRLVPGKGLEDLIRALSLLPDQCILLMIGDGPCRPEAQKISQLLGVSNRVVWVKHISSLKIPEYINLMDVLVLPSRTIPMGKILPTGAVKEQFGRVLVEAMACETPVVGSNSGEIPKVIGDGGLVFPEGDSVALAHRITYLYDNPKLAGQIGANGRMRVLENFTHQRIAQETVNFYKQILAHFTANPELACAAYN